MKNDYSMETVNIALEGTCRFCQTPLKHTFVDLGTSPLCQDVVKPDELKKMEPFYPLHAYICENCFLVQLEEFVSPQVIYRDYRYFSSYSDTWLRHCKQYTDKVVERFHLSGDSLVVELASNDGYLLQYFTEKNIPVVGVEPAAATAEQLCGFQQVADQFVVCAADETQASLSIFFKYGDAHLYSSSANQRQ